MTDPRLDQLGRTTFVHLGSEKVFARGEPRDHAGALCADDRLPIRRSTAPHDTRRHRRPRHPPAPAERATARARPVPVPQSSRPADLSAEQPRPALRAAPAPGFRDGDLHPRRRALPPRFRRPREHHRRGRGAVDDGGQRARAFRAFVGSLQARGREARDPPALGQPARAAQADPAGLRRPPGGPDPRDHARRRTGPARRN